MNSNPIAGPSTEAGSMVASKRRRKADAGLSPLQRLTPDEVRTLWLDEDSRAEFDACVRRFSDSRADLHSFAGEDVGSMNDDRYDQLSAAQAAHSTYATAVVHFLAPRIMRLRDGASQRKWRSFLTKFRKDEKLT